MEVPILQEQSEEFDHRNLLLQLTLGMLSAGQRLDALLERYAPAETRQPLAPADSPDGLLHFVLGLVSFRECLHAELEAGAPLGRESVAPARDGENESSGSALRGLLR